MTALAPHLGTFLQQHLPRDRHASRHTVESYTDSFRLLVVFAADRLGRRPCLLEIEQLTAPFILDFLDFLERARGNSARTRNARLVAIKSFFKKCCEQHFLNDVKQIVMLSRSHPALH